MWVGVQQECMHLAALWLGSSSQQSLSSFFLCAHSMNFSANEFVGRNDCMGSSSDVSTC